MAKRKNGFDMSAIKKYAGDLQAAGGMAAIKRAVDAGTRATKAQVNRNVRALMAPSNLPAGGKYATGATLGALDTEAATTWEGNMARVKLGFKLDGPGLVSIFLMYGTPHMAPVSGLREALKEDPRKISRKEMTKASKKILERLGR